MHPLRGWSRLGVFPAAGSARASARTVSGPALGPSLESLVPSSPRRLPGLPVRAGRLSWDFVPYDTLQLLASAEAEVRKRNVPTASAVGP